MADKTSFLHSFVETGTERSQDVSPADRGPTGRQTDRQTCGGGVVGGVEGWKCGGADKQMVGKWGDGQRGEESDRQKDRWAARRQTDGSTNETRPVWKLDVNVKVESFAVFFSHFKLAESAANFFSSLLRSIATIHSVSINTL